MAVAITNKTANTAAASTSHNTASISILSGRLYLVSVFGNAAPAVAPTLSGLSQTWTQIRTDGWDDVGAGIRRNTTVFRCRATSDQGPAPITIDWGSTSTTPVWSVNEVTGDDTSGSNGSGAIGDTDFSFSDTGATSGAVTELTLQNSSSANYATWSHRTGEATDIEGGWSELSDTFTGSFTSLEVQYQLNDSTATASWATSSKWAGTAIEIKAAAAAAAPTFGGQMLWGVG